MHHEIVSAIKKLYGDRFGLKDDAYTNASWESLIAKRMNEIGCTDLDAYYHLLLRSKTEFDALGEKIVVPETWFFREPDAIEFAVHKITKEKKRISILDIACSSGEEAYSIAMLLMMTGVQEAHYRIDAVDVSKLALTKAKHGAFRLNAFRNKRYSSIKLKFFDRIEDLYLLKSSVKGRVHFQLGNAVAPDFMKGHPKYEMVFCRNLIIYLSTQAQEQLLDNIKSLLTETGLLFVGATEGEILRKQGWSAHEPINLAAYSPPSKDIVHSELLKKPKMQKIMKPLFQQHALQGEHPLKVAAKMADEGLYLDAREACMKYLKREGRVDPDAYFLMGVIEHACQNNGKAEGYFEKTIYLMPRHPEALAYLVLLAEERGDDGKAAVYRDRLHRIGEMHG